jgi:hypothetical protein
VTAELVHYNASLPDKIQYAEHLAVSGLLPDVYRRQPANVLYAIEYGETIGIGTMAAITGVHIIKGKPSASSALISGLVRRAGHKLRVTGNDVKGVAVIRRADDPEFEFRSEWTLDRAVTAGLCELRNGKPYARDEKNRPTSWEKYPAAMLKARAITEVARDACEEVLFGLHYTPEELGAEVDEEGNITVVVEPRRPSAPVADQWTRPEPAPVPAAPVVEPDGIEDAEVIEDPAADPAAPAGQLPPPSPLVPTASKAQLTKLSILLGEKRGLTERDACVAAVAAMVRRPLKSRTELSKAEANSVITTLSAEPDHVPLEDNPVRDVLTKLVAEASTFGQLAEAGRDIAAELARGNLTRAEADVLRAAWIQRQAALSELDAMHQEEAGLMAMAGAETVG